ncbi:MAG: cation:proton antiporter [Bacteroides sp.]|nr:cation:proton antiporter [Bacteroides sp.]MCM1413889.1 cation:proton antiporter [Bacteroides sp.]
MLTASILLSVAPSELGIESLIRDLAFILILGAITTLFFKWIKQPVVLGYIVAGFLASPNFEYLPSVTTAENIEFWAQIGIIVLLFSLGLEFSFKKLLNAGGSAVVTALIIVIGMMVAGFCIGHVLGFSNINSLFLGGMLSMSSTTIIIKAFNDLNIVHKKFASQVFAVLIVEDLFAVLMMVILSSIAINNSVQGSEMLFSISKLAFFLIIWFAVGVFILPSALNRTRQYLNSETLLIVSMGLCLGMAVFSVYCGFSLALGAFVMGSILAGTSFAERIEHVTVPIKDLFGSVFFISVGMMVNPHIIVQYAGPILLLSLVVIVGMITFGTFGMLVSGQTLKVAIESGFSLTQIGEFAFIIATLGMQLGVLDPTIYPIVVAVSVLTTFTTPYFIRMADPFYNFIERHLPRRLNFLIDRYSEKAVTESVTGRIWRDVLKRYTWRIMLYTCVLTAIVLIANKWLLPAMIEVSPSWGRLITSAIALAAMSPFLLALSYPSSKKSERETLRKAHAHMEVPLVVLRIFRLLIALAFICYIFSAIYSPRYGVIVGVLIFILIMFVVSKNISRRMKRIEQKFMDNLNERELRRSGRNNNIISNLHLAFMTVSYGCKYVGMRLSETDLRSTYGVSVAAIQRGSTNIPVPAGDVRIFPADTLSVIGTEDEIQRLLPVIEAPERQLTTDQVKPSDLKFTSLELSDSSPLVGYTVGQSQLSTTYQSLLVSIQRNGNFLNHDSSTIFKPGDILWLVANPKLIAKLA